MRFPEDDAPGEGPERIRKLVEHLLPRLIAGDDAVSAVLRAQLGRARIGSISLSGVGFFADIEVPADAPLVVPREFAGGDARIELAGVPHGAGCVLFVRDGRLSCLEGYSYGETWSEDTVVTRVEDVVPIRPPDPHDG